MPNADKIQVASLAHDLHHAILHLLRGARRDDQRTGVPPAQLSVLSVLVFGGPRRVGDLARIEQVSAPAMSRIARELEQKAMVLRKPDPSDRRSQWLEATPEARQLMLKARGRRVSLVADALRTLDEADLAVLSEAVPLMLKLSRKTLE